jgi:hypothetical protein
MKIISFEYLGKVGDYDLGELEIVEWFFFKKKLKIFKVTSYWRFVETGGYTPGDKVEELYLGWTAKQKFKELK